MCGIYAVVRVVLCDAQMKPRAEGEGSIWKFKGQEWKEIVQTTAGDWACDDVRGIPKHIRICLGVDQCL